MHTHIRTHMNSLVNKHGSPDGTTKEQYTEEVWVSQGNTFNIVYSSAHTVDILCYDTCTYISQLGRPGLAYLIMRCTQVQKKIKEYIL